MSVFEYILDSNDITCYLVHWQSDPFPKQYGHLGIEVLNTLADDVSKVCNCSVQPSLCLKSCSLFSKKYEYCDYHEITTCLQILEASARIVTNQDQEFGI